MYKAAGKIINMFRTGLVKAMQIQLNKYGFDANPEDGVFGSRTLNAYTAFLKTQNREADAYLSGQTIMYLKSVADDYPRLYRSPGLLISQIRKTRLAK